jgi:hypothetical protein
MLKTAMKSIGNPMDIAFKHFKLLKQSVEVAYLCITWGRVFYLCIIVHCGLFKSNIMLVVNNV